MNIFNANINIMADTHARFEMYQNNNLLWAIEVAELDFPVLAGLADSFTYILNTLGLNGNFQCFLFYENEEKRLTLEEIYSIGDATRVGEVERGFLAPGDDTIQIIRDRFVILRHINDNETEYMMVAFDSPRFIQGFIMGCNACNFDFRTIIHGLPFKINADETITYYDVPGYLTEMARDMPGRLL